MSQPDIRAALDPLRAAERPFAPDTRKTPRRAPAPVVLHLDVPYRQWDGPPLPFAEDIGKKGGQVYSRDGAEPQRTCNEVEVAKRLRLARAHAYWFSAYQPGQIPAIWRPWTRAPSEAPAWFLELDAAIRTATRRATGGNPDVVAWDDDTPLGTALFVECKGAKESFKEG